MPAGTGRHHVARVKNAQLEIVPAPHGEVTNMPAPAGYGRSVQVPGQGQVQGYGGAQFQPRPAVRRRGRLREFFRFGSRGSLFLFVGLPTLLTAIYFAFIATPQFISESTFLVRSSNEQSMSGLGALLRTTGIGSMGDPSYAVAEYVKSRDALARLNRDVDFSAMLARPEADFLSRFPTFYSGSTQEDLYDAFQKFVTAVYDSSTGVTTLDVRAFRPEDAQKISQSLLASSEDLINRMNERSRRDAVALATQEVDRAHAKVEQLQVAITEYRVREGVIDPRTAASSTVSILAGLNKELSETQASIAQAQALSPQSPQIRSLQSRATAIRQQIAQQQSAVLGPDGHIATSLAQFQRLLVDEEFAEKELAAANASLDVARADALRKQVYLERISDPSTPDRSRYPRRVISTLTVFTILFIGYAILWLLMANVREHAS